MVTQKIKVLESVSTAESKRWGVDYLCEAVHSWERAAQQEERDLLLDNVVSAAFLKTVRNFRNSGPRSRVETTWNTENWIKQMGGIDV